MKTAILIPALLLICSAAAAQGPRGGMNRVPVSSPVVNPDKTVTFNYRNDNAKEVKLSSQLAPTVDMKRDENGIWTVTVGPVRPDLYPYCFVVDGINVQDPLNPDWFPNEKFKNSLVDVRNDNQDEGPYALRDVPHGAVDYINYPSATLGLYGRALVYTPPTYYKDKDRRYPVFYLISGTTDTEEVYFKVGRMNVILDNLIAEGKAEEMIIVLPYGNPALYYSPEQRSAYKPDSFNKDFLDDLMPYVENNYRTQNAPESRAIGGFSRGGNQALALGLSNTDRFAYLCSYSSFTSMTLPGVYDNANELNSKIKLFWLGVGTDDFLYGNAKEYMDFLDSKGIRNTKVFTDDKGGHTWMNARYFLCESLPLLFKK